MALRNKRQRIILVTVFIIGAVLRLVLAYVHSGESDIANFAVSAEIFRQGGNIYSEQPYYNYSPVWGIIIGWLSRLNIPFHFAQKGFLSVIDLLNAILIYRITGNLRTFCLYALNPGTIWLIGYYGQFEAFAILPLLLAAYLYLHHLRVAH